MPSESEGVSATILVVEDDEDIGAFLVQAIKQETSYKSLLATNGFQALKIVSEIKPVLFLIDYQLPGMTGLELSDRLHSDPGLAAVPIIMMSARLPAQELSPRKITGIRKPFDLQNLLDTIESLLDASSPKAY